MNKEEVLAYANKTYPIGTKYKGQYGSSTVQGILKYYNHASGQMVTDGYGGAVLHDGVWAEVVSHPQGYEPQPQITNLFPIY